MNQARKILTPNLAIILSIILGILTGMSHISIFNQLADILSQLFMNVLKLIGTPIIFLSIFSTVLGMKNISEFKVIGVRILRYTFLTTWIAACVALIMLLIINPTHTKALTPAISTASVEQSYLYYLVNIIPANIIKPFSENQVFGILFLAILFSAASLALPNEQRVTLHQLFSSLSALIFKIASWVVALIPIAIWSFITILFKNFKSNTDIQQIFLYLMVVVSANLIQGLIILPLFAKLKGVSPSRLLSHMMPALITAFFSKSSSGTLPLTMQCAEERANLPKKLTQLAFPLCTAVNMNGCAGFILTTVLFVSMSHGIPISLSMMIMWTFIATIAAVGNAGVPMGCYFLASAFLAAMNVPLTLMAVILPFYTLLDMLETMFNVWSDCCVVSVVHRDLELAKELMPTPNWQASS